MRAVLDVSLVVDFHYQACAFFWFFHETKDEALRKRFAGAVSTTTA